MTYRVLTNSRRIEKDFLRTIIGFSEDEQNTIWQILRSHLGRPKTAKKARCSYPECGPRHEVPVPISVPMRFGGACPSELHYPGQPDSTRVQRPG